MNELVIRKNITKKEAEYLREQLREYNLRVAPPVQDYISKNVELVLEDENKKLYGGLIGKIYRACLFIDILWVSESNRGVGYGKNLLQRAESIAKEESCTFIHLDTFGFQALEFYQKTGFKIYGVLDLYSDGVKRYYLKKELR